MTCYVGWKPVTNYQEDAWQVGISGLRIFWHLLAWSDSKWCTCWIIVFSSNLCCHYREIFGPATGTSCFNQWWDCRTKSPVCKLVTSKQQVKPSYSDWMKSLEFATKVFTRLVTEQLEILKSTSPLVQTLSIPCWWWRPFVILEEFS